jgi:RluA family pseudouridine synthase
MAIFELGKQDAGRNVLDILRDRIPAASRSYLRQLLRSGKIKCAGKVLTESSCLQGHETLQLPDSSRLRKLCAVPLPELTILLETDAFLVVFKPAGLAVHSSVGHTADNLTDRLRAWIRHRKLPYRVAPVHRLDVGTSGPVIFGKGRKATAELGRSLQAGRMRKTYLALVHGKPPETGIMTTAVQVQGKTKEAATRYRVRGRHGNAALLELELLSGRKHQIRQQCSQAGWPLYGDSRYGGPGLEGLDRLFLHCWQLAWPTDADQPHYCVSSPLPEELCSVLHTLHIGLPSPG